MTHVGHIKPCDQHTCFIFFLGQKSIIITSESEQPCDNLAANNCALHICNIFIILIYCADLI